MSKNCVEMVISIQLHICLLNGKFIYCALLFLVLKKALYYSFKTFFDGKIIPSRLTCALVEETDILYWATIARADAISVQSTSFMIFVVALKCNSLYLSLTTLCSEV